MERVADADTSHLTIDCHEGEWQPILAGVAIKVLREHEGVLSYLLRLDPGAVLPPHRHPRDEECVVLEGRLRVGTQVEIGPGATTLPIVMPCTRPSRPTQARPSSFGVLFPRRATCSGDQADLTTVTSHHASGFAHSPYCFDSLGQACTAGRAAATWPMGQPD